MFRPPSSAAPSLRVPDGEVGEVIGGKMHLKPHPTPAEEHSLTVLLRQLMPVTQGRDPWEILQAPTLYLGAEPDILVPLLAGCPRSELGVSPSSPVWPAVPDWVCELVSEATSALVRGRKLALYARDGVQHVWLLDVESRAIQAMHLEAGAWARTEVCGGYTRGRLEPFERVELDVAALWT